MHKILIIDHNDSFTYNLVELFRQQGNCSVDVLLPEQFQDNTLLHYNGLVLSPGPGLPAEQKLTNNIIKQAINFKIPILGICLGHQILIEYFGGNIEQLNHIVHGEATSIKVLNSGVYSGLPKFIDVGRYHSWVANENDMPKNLKINAKTNDGLIMSFVCKELNINGLQYHPESVLTPQGKQIIANWISFCVAN